MTIAQKIHYAEFIGANWLLQFLFHKFQGSIVYLYNIHTIG